jgi:hypothetical protein
MDTPPLKQVIVGGRIISIRIDPKLDDWGNYHSDQREITVSPAAVANLRDFYETLRHEFKHIALDMAGHSYLPKMQQYEEPIVRAFDAIYDPAVDLLQQQFKPL